MLVINQTTYNNKGQPGQQIVAMRCRLLFFLFKCFFTRIDILLFSSFCVDSFFFFLCGQKEETRKNREHAPPSNKWAFRCLAAELAASPLRQSSPETTPKSLICYRRLPLSFAPLTPRHLSGKCEGLLLSFATCRGRCSKGSCYRSPFVGAGMRRGAA